VRGTCSVLNTVDRAEHSPLLTGGAVANYLSSLIQCALFAATLVDGDFPEHQQLCNLRRQCEKAANESALYRRQSAQWISWDDVMRTRECCNFEPPAMSRLNTRALDSQA
jgi:hypothetical protein